MVTGREDIASVRYCRGADEDGVNSYNVLDVTLASGVAPPDKRWPLVVSAAFWVVRLDNLTYLFNSLLDFARWPVSVFKGAIRVVFTFVIPLALMTTYPAEALLGRIEARTAALSIAGAVAFALASRLLWTRAIGRYTSASS